MHVAAALLSVSADTVYDLFAKGELPGRKVGRKWITTKAAYGLRGAVRYLLTREAATSYGRRE